jgi:hypothetical protein
MSDPKSMSWTDCNQSGNLRVRGENTIQPKLRLYLRAIYVGRTRSFGIGTGRKPQIRDVMKGTSGDPVCRQTAYSAGGIFEDFGLFLAILVDFGHFWTSFFPFSLFFHFRRRYTRAEEVTLYYRSSQKGFKAPQLGPRAYRILRFCPACGFGIKPLVSLGPIVFECCREHIPDIGTHRTHPPDPTHRPS